MTPVLQGKRLVLRPPRASDKSDRLTYGRNPEFRKMVGGNPRDCPTLTDSDVEQWYIQISQAPLNWIIDHEGKCIGEARLHSVDQNNRSARYAIGIFDPLHWNRGFGTEATRLVLSFAFEKLNFHRVDLRVLAFNERAIACYKKCGFVQEGVIRDALLLDDEWQSDILMSVLEQENKPEHEQE